MFINELKLLLRFDNAATIFDEISQTNMSVLGTNTVPILMGSGYQMQDDQYLFGDGVLSNGFNLDFTTDLTISFWLYSVSPGIAIDEKTGTLLPIEMPLINIIDTSSASNPIIEIVEETRDTGNNVLRIIEEGKYTAYSEEYEPNSWHHFWIVHSPKPTGLQIFVDGTEHTLQDETDGFSSNLTDGLGTLFNLYINHSIDGYSSSVAKNTGVIDDLFILNTSINAVSDIQRVINDGLLYLLDDDFNTTNINKYSIYFNDPETITINSMIDDLSYVFIGRNDGKILRGSTLFWESRKSFSDPREHVLLGLDPNYAEASTIPNSGRVDGFLQLINETIRL